MGLSCSEGGKKGIRHELKSHYKHINVSGVTSSNAFVKITI